MTIPATRAYEIIEEHERAKDLRYFTQKYCITHVNISQRSWNAIRELKKMDRILKRLKSTNKV